MARRPTPARVLALIDVTLVGVAIALALFVRTSPAFQPFWGDLGLPPVRASSTLVRTAIALGLFQAFAIPFVLMSRSWYQPRPHDGASQVWASVGTLVLLTQYPIFGMLYLVRGLGLPRGFLVADLVLLVALLPAWRVYWGAKERKALQAGQGLRNVLIVGSGETARAVAAEIVREPLHGMRVVGFVADHEVSLNAELPPEVFAQSHLLSGHHTPEAAEARSLKSVVAANVRSQPRHILSTVAGAAPEEFAQALDGLLVEHVLVCTEVGEDVATEVVRACRERNIEVHLVPPHYAALATTPTPWSLGPFPVVRMYDSLISRTGSALKRAMDIAGSGAGLVVASPIVAVIALAIKLENPRLPIFYRSARVGQKGRQFPMLKFTTMRPDAQRLEADLKRLNTREGPWFKIDSSKDPRLTRVGRVLRKYSLNEIPQLWNIFVGHMSLVGPRPPLPDEVASYVQYDFRYYRCLDVKPGLTGLWQVYGRRNPSFEARIEYDLEYIRNWSVWLDLKLILLTPQLILREREE